MLHNQPQPQDSKSASESTSQSVKKTPINPSQSILDILKLIQFNTWILFDLDNTVMESTEPLGSDQWFKKLLDKSVQFFHGNKEFASGVAVTIYNLVERYVSTQAVEPTTASLIKVLQDIGLTVIAITARDYAEVETSNTQLEQAGNIDFTRYHENRTIYLGPKVPGQAVYHNGIIYCNGKDKGNCLDLFLEFCENLPTHCAMIDDKLHHVEAVFRAVEKRESQFDGLHYTLLDKKVEAFEMDVANSQLASVLPNLSKDIEAELKKQDDVISHAMKEKEKLKAALSLFHHLCPPGTEKEAKSLPLPPVETLQPARLPARGGRKRGFHEVESPSRLFHALDLERPVKKARTGIVFRK